MTRKRKVKFVIFMGMDSISISEHIPLVERDKTVITEIICAINVFSELKAVIAISVIFSIYNSCRTYIINVCLNFSVYSM